MHLLHVFQTEKEGLLLLSRKVSGIWRFRSIRIHLKVPTLANKCPKLHLRYQEGCAFNVLGNCTLCIILSLCFKSTGHVFDYKNTINFRMLVYFLNMQRVENFKYWATQFLFVERSGAVRSRQTVPQSSSSPFTTDCFIVQSSCVPNPVFHRLFISCNYSDKLIIILKSLNVMDYGIEVILFLIVTRQTSCCRFISTFSKSALHFQSLLFRTTFSTFFFFSFLFS